MKRIHSFNNDWMFWLDRTCGEELPQEGVHWAPVQLPHDWQIWQVGNLYEDGTGWYRKRFDWCPEAGVRCALYFEGVYMDTTLFVNGQWGGDWKYGYSSFHYDVTDLLIPGENEVCVRCRLRHPNSRWYSGAGIYRDVWLWELPETHLLPHSLYIVPREAGDGHWTVDVQAEVGRSGGGPLDLTSYQVEFCLLDEDGRLLDSQRVPAERGVPSDEAAIQSYAQGETDIHTLSARFTLERPRLWELGAPYRYQLRARLLEGTEELDALESGFGCRTVELDPERGLFLNHRPVKLHGVCMHHDLGCLGAAFSMAAAERQFRLLLEMGVNAIRTAHNMPAPGIMELADRYGVLVVSEAFDIWRSGKNPYDYHRFFPEWYRRDVASWVRRDRNHPSLMLWSIGNEIYDTHAGPQGMETTRDLLDQVRLHDPMGNGAVTMGSNYMAWENTQNCADILKIAGYNYGERLYDEHHAKHPDWVIYGSETGSIVQSRGIYHFPLSQSLLVDDDMQCSSLGNSRTSWGAADIEACLAADREHPYSLGQFIWSGFDYIGEPTPYHTKNSYFGQLDTAGFPKDSFYHYQAGWTDWRTKPVVHVLPYWDFNEGQRVDICVISNAPSVELWVNGVSQGKRNMDGACRSASWQAPYAPGSLVAIAYDEEGREIARDIEHSFEDPVSLRIHADRQELSGDGKELVFCTITALDRKGWRVKNANNRVTVRVHGPARLVGLDNGDSTDPDEYKGTVRQLFSGKLLAVAAGTAEGGQAEIEVTSPGLAPARVPLTVWPCPQETAARHPLLEVGEDCGLVPVRKLELRADRNVLSPEHPSAELTVRLHPANAGYSDLEWRVTDDRGITAEEVKLEYLDEKRTKVRAIGRGDGQVRVRCTCKNGREVPQLISQLELTVQGMGSIYPDPYSFLCASLYTQSHGEIGNGNERGIATSRTEMSWVAYDQLDFGRAGSDTIDIDVFELAGEPTPIRFWKGAPYGPGSRMIGERVYDKPSRWNVYQPETFRLDEKLTGLQTFGIELQRKVHIKGFTFQRGSRARDYIPATAHDMLYGDSYKALPEAITGIGNNVSLVFRELDFGTQGLRQVTIWGRTPLENNTIHICFQGADGEQRRIVEFAYQEDFGPQTFQLEPVCGMQDVTFLFLPGSSFDFQGFQFG